MMEKIDKIIPKDMNILGKAQALKIWEESQKDLLKNG
jgi:hypothetical protein